ncbi:ABC-2 transporter permease [Ruminiclostridium herbifermentans]|uniref:ABC-2 transporter permease n=1 Tax=Ruminiclostridium herbifermentans TaxID=2488810 RepID=A0A4U7JGE3_9FIRM|nr:ABC-2 transporter permease [Ruminiclostridium herbifermentans]QNU67046.1 ABC-2 transporter permease [Ruminiclostridium herbifermentans]
MTDIIKSTLLDAYLLKYYKKSICFVLLIPVFFVLINRSLISGISFSMTFMAMTSGYTFSISEKNNMNRLYGILPASKSDMVIGRYFLLLCLGIFTLLFSLIMDSIALNAINVSITIGDIVASSLVGICLYIIYISFQLPGYYKFGPIRGRAFMYIPIVGFLAILLILDKKNADFSFVFRFISENPLLFIICLLILLIGLYASSIIISTHILKNKED